MLSSLIIVVLEAAGWEFEALVSHDAGVRLPSIPEFLLDIQPRSSAGN